MFYFIQWFALYVNVPNVDVCFSVRGEVCKPLLCNAIIVKTGSDVSR